MLQILIRCKTIIEGPSPLFRNSAATVFRPNSGIKIWLHHGEVASRKQLRCELNKNSQSPLQRQIV